MLVIAFLGNNMIDMDAFNSVHTVGTIIVTRNMVCLLQLCFIDLLLLQFLLILEFREDIRIPWFASDNQFTINP